MVAIVNCVGKEIGFACDFIMTGFILTSFLLIVAKSCGAFIERILGGNNYVE